MSPRQPLFAVKLPAWQKWTVYLSFGALTLSGALWLALDTRVRVEGEFGPEHHPAQPWLLALHGVVGFAFLVAAGALLPVHIRLAWAARRNRTTGLVIGGISALLAVTGAILYYAADETVRQTASIGHWSLGFLGAIVLIAHIVTGRGKWRSWRKRV